MIQLNHYIKGRLCRTVLSALVVSLVAILLAPSLYAQRGQTPFRVFGVVTDERSVPIMGAVIRIQESTVFTETDEMGEYDIEVPGMGAILTIEARGFLSQSVTVSGERADVVLQVAPIGQEERDRIDLPWAVSDRRRVTASVARMTHDELRQSPVMSLSRAVSGRLPGFTVIQQAGDPGFSSENWTIRGDRTLVSGGMNNMTKGGYGAPIAIVDGFEREWTDFDASEIESISILRDAAALNIYGLRGANGVILVNTRRGQENRRTIDLELSSGIVTPTRMPHYLGSYDYARLFNEARLNDGLSEVYDENDLALYANTNRAADDPTRLSHPDNDYLDMFLRDYVMQSKAALTLSGGNPLGRYFVSISYNREQGLYDRTTEGPDFDVASAFNRFNTRVNLDINITDRLSAAVNLAGRLELRKYPYSSEGYIFGLLTDLPPNAFPIEFRGIDPDIGREIHMLGGSTVQWDRYGYNHNPLGVLSNRGYTDGTRRYYQMGATVRYELDFITEGLYAQASIDNDGYSLYNVSRFRAYPVWEYLGSADGTEHRLMNTPGSLSTGSGWNARTWYGTNFNLNYDREFGEHHFQAFAMMRRFRTDMPWANQPDLKNEDFALRLNWGFRNRYFIEATGTLASNDNIYETLTPRVFLPVISGAWIVSDEDFLAGSDIVSFLKLRASHGLTANDWYTWVDPNNLRYRFPYRNRYWSTASGTAWGVSLAWGPTHSYEGAIPNLGFTAERGRISNLGIDLDLLESRLSLSTDLWFERRFDIYTNGEGTIPMTLGVFPSEFPIINEGIVESQGLELTLGWRDQIGTNITYWMRGMFDVSKNTIVEMSEPGRDFDYQVETGGPVRQDWGLIAMGLFMTQEEVDNSPEQTFGPYGVGDIRYQDVNGDGQIDVNDMVAIGEGRWPTISYAMDMGLRAGNFDFSLFWQGSSRRSYYQSSNYYRPFTSFGSVSEFSLDRAILDTDANGDLYVTNPETATSPRLSTQYSDNNYRISTFWLQDVTFLRLRNAEIGYNLSNINAERLGLHGVRLYVNAYNLLTFDNVGTHDPEDPFAGITRHPVSRITNLGVILKF